MKLVAFSTNKRTTDTHFMVSDEDYDKVIPHLWHVSVDGNGNHFTICRTATKEEEAKGHPKTVKVHRFIMDFYKGDKAVVDHKNSWLDNTREGLRITSQKNNSRYSSRSKNRHSNLPKGVTLSHGRINPYRSQITVDDKHIDLGCFPTIEEAKNVYNEAAVKYFGEYAKFK